MTTYLINLINRLHFKKKKFLNKYVKFHGNQMLFIIKSINLFFTHNFRPQKLKIKTID